MFTFLGTGAGENYPNSWCRCPNCQKSRELGGKNLRSNTSAVLGNHTLIDFGPALPFQAERAGLVLGDLQSIFITHTHFDHYAPWYLRWRFLPDVQDDLVQLQIFGSEEAREMAELAVKGKWKEHRLEFRVIKPWDMIQTDKLSAVALPANHDDRRTCINFLFDLDGYQILYAVDSAELHGEVLDFLDKTGVSLDLVVMDANWGTANIEASQLKGHASFDINRQTLEIFRERSILRKSGVFVVTHLSPHYAPVHEECEKILSPLGITVAYDGMRIR